MKNLILFLGLCILIFNEGCRCCNDCTDPNCKNYNPCCGVQKLTADFIVRQSCWDPYLDEWMQWRLKNIENSDTMVGSRADLISEYDSVAGVEYIWKFDGMSKTFHTKNLIGVDFSSYVNNYTQNYNPLWDSFYTKPLGVTLTVIDRNNKCSGSDTVITVRHELVFAQREMHYGRFRGYFSTNPNQEVEYWYNSIHDIYFNYWERYFGLPWKPNDTLDVNFNLQPNGRDIIDSFFISYHKYYWVKDFSEPQTIAQHRGIVGMRFNSHFNGNLKRNEVEILFKYKASDTSVIQNITFKGYQIEAFKKSFKE